MLARWPIRNKLWAGIGLLLVMLGTLSISGFQGVYAYRGLVKSLRARADELPLATTLGQQVGDLRVALAAWQGEQSSGGTWSVAPLGGRLLDEELRVRFDAVNRTLALYQEQIEANDDQDERIGDSQFEAETAARIQADLDKIARLVDKPGGEFPAATASALNEHLEKLQRLAAELPSHLHRRLGVMAGEVRTQYRAMIGMLWTTTLSAAAMLILLIHLFYRWVFRPLRVLIHGSRIVAAGRFDHRIRLECQDEMGELAAAMNDMTDRFQAIRDDLDTQVKIRTRQVVRSEQLASVGFLAAGVAHEINNPLAAIAMCAESLEGRLAELAGTGLQIESNPPDARRPADGVDADSLAVMSRYLAMIQSEAFRCKGITEKLLDFSRLGEVTRQPAELRPLVESVVEMVRHVGKYHDKQIELAPADGHETATACVNPQEIKQVVLNLITNALDSMTPGGTLQIEVGKRGSRAELSFRDDGCGMTEEVLAHLFEPFFTRKRGGQGTGLGLSIVHRIVNDHGGQIDAESDGPGCGSTFRVWLPLTEPRKENRHRYQAA